MATAAEYARSILLKVFAVGSEQPIEQIDAQDVLVAMNDYMARQDSVGVSVGWTTLSDLGDTITSPDWAATAIKFNVAVQIANEHGFTVAPATHKIAMDSYADLLTAVVSVDPVAFPSTLPVGAGNQCGSDSWSPRFFPANDSDEALTEQNGSILLEDDTE